MGRDYFLKIRDPRDPGEGSVDAVFPGRYTERLYKQYPVQFQNLVAAKYVLENVKRVFSGVRVFNEGGWCYTGRPKTWMIRERVMAPFPEHLVLAVYLNPRMHVYEFRAELRDADDEFSPIDWRNRYEGLVWKAIS